MIEESKYCNKDIKINYSKELVRSKRDTEDFKNATKCKICDNDYVNKDV